MAGRKPDYNLTVKPKGENSYASQIGVGWKDDFGGVSIKLNPCVVLSHMDDVWINLYLNEDRNKPRRVHNRQPSEADYDYGPPPMTDDDVPF